MHIFSGQNPNGHFAFLIFNILKLILELHPGYVLDYLMFSLI